MNNERKMKKKYVHKDLLSNHFAAFHKIKIYCDGTFVLAKYNILGLFLFCF
jgi:hypothetical protein